MNIDDIRTERRKLETRIRDEVKAGLRDFREATGLSPSSIHVGLLRLETIGQKEPEYIVNDVTACVPL